MKTFNNLKMQLHKTYNEYTISTLKEIAVSDFNLSFESIKSLKKEQLVDLLVSKELTNHFS